jgi:protein-tyrosine phosphatase
VFYGSHGRKDNNYYSDLDSFIYYNESYDRDIEQKVKEKILGILNSDDEGISNNFEINDTWIVYTERSFIKLEIGIKSISEAINDTIFIIESRISSPEQAIAYDKNDRVKKIYSENWVKLDDSEKLKERFISESYKFIYYFEESLSSFGISDSYRTYMNYSRAYNTLVGLQSMIDGNYLNLYQPRDFIIGLFYSNSWDLAIKYIEALVGLRRSDMIDQKDNLKGLFLEVIDQGIKYFNLEKRLTFSFQKFFEKIDIKYPPFPNLRDISLIPNFFSDTVKIKEGLIYRTASLSQNNKDLVFKFLQDKNIKYIIDLRGKSEIERVSRYNNFYDDEIKEKFVINIPIEPDAVTSPPDKPIEQFYLRFLMEFQNEIKTVFEEYFSKASSDKLVIHCVAGKDRTGILVALLLDLLGVSRNLIIEDYLLSFLDTNRRYPC